MDDVSARKKKIEEKLKLSEVQLNELRESLEKSDQLTTSMVTILDSFTTRLKKLDEAIVPVYQQTRRLTQLQENVEKTLGQMDRLIGFHHVADEVETKVQDGPSGDVEGYIKVLDRLKVALDFFHANNPSSVELSHVQELFESGLESLQRDFLNMLKRSSKPVAVAILNDIATCEDVEDMPPLEHLPTRTVSELRVTAEYLIAQSNAATVVSAQHKDILSVYAQLRSNQLGRSLNAFKEANLSSQLLPSSLPKKSSFAAALLKGHGPSPAKRVTKRSEVARRGDSSSRIGPSGSFMGDIGAAAEEQLEGCGYIMASTTVFLRLIEGEAHLMRQIIPPPHHCRVLKDLTAQPIEFYVKEVEMLYQLASKSLAHHSFPVVISVFRLIRHMQGLMPEYRTVLEGLDGAPYDRFETLVKQFQKLNQKALEDYIGHIKGNPEKQSNLPKDGTVHELTSHTMWFVEQLLEYSRNVGEAIHGESSFGVILEAERRKALGHYLVRVLDALNLNMENKARSYESPQLASLFLLNNYHFIHKTFTRHELMQKLLEEAYERIEEDYISHVQNHMRGYQRCFAKLISYLGQEVSAAAAGSDKLSKSAKQALKDKFKGFNTELEELFRVQQHWSIPDAQLRERVRRDNVEIVGPLYTEFYRVYSMLHFTKNPEKYLKYTPEMLEDTMEKFFDGGM